jgi:hypothetical protein
MSAARPNPWSGAVIVKLSVVRSNSPIAFFSARFPLLEMTVAGCALWRTRAGKLWAAPPKQRRQLPDGAAQYEPILEFDGGGAASRFSTACIDAIGRHSPELLTPLLEAHAEPAPRTLPQPRRDDDVPDWWLDR